MLHELVRYGESHGLMSKPGFAAKRARWLITLAENGQFVGVVPGDREYPMAPDLTQPELVGGTTPRSHFLLDSLTVVAQYGAGDESRQQQKHANFVGLLREAASVCPECGACAGMLEDADTRALLHKELEAHKAKPTDTATFRVGVRHLPEMTEWHAWWQSYRSTLRSAPDADDADGNTMLCFVTGDTVTPAPTHAKVKGLSQVGGQPSGASLISFDKEAFTSYGFEQSANAAVSEEAVVRYAGALQDLVNKAPRPLGGTLLLHWYDRPVPAEFDLFDDLNVAADRAGEEATAALKARKVLEAIHAGTRAELTYNRYYVLQIAGAGGRITVRDWFSDDFVKLVRSINDWYDHLELVGPYGGEPSSTGRLAALLMRLVPYRPSESISDTFKRINQQLPPLMPRLWRAILQGAPLPDAVAQAALAYVRSRQQRADDDQSADNLDRIACSLLKAWLLRRADTRTHSAQKRSPLMEPKVNKEHPAPAYQAGRLLAVLAHLQNTALPGVGAGVVQRYYAAASSTPALVVGRMVRNAQFHLDKIESKGLVYWYEQQIAEIMARLGDGLPATLALEGQTLFALGYYQQKAEMSSRKASGAPAPDATTDAVSTPESSTGEN